jgi:hypothetical protein
VFYKIKTLPFHIYKKKELYTFTDTKQLSLPHVQKNCHWNTEERKCDFDSFTNKIYLAVFTKKISRCYINEETDFSGLKFFGINVNASVYKIMP